VPPTKPIRVSQTIDLMWPEHRINHRRSAIIPVAALPLKDADAIKRCKLIAGPRWTPGRPGVDETAYQTNRGFNGGAEDIGKEGWLKMTGEKLDNGRMNRKMISDNLDRLIQAANVRCLACMKTDRRTHSRRCPWTFRWTRDTLSRESEDGTRR